MAEPKPKSLDLPAYLTRIVPIFQTPQWMEADRWRRTVENQPVAMVCEEHIIADLQDTSWEVRAKDAKNEDKLADDIDYYNKLLEPDLSGGIAGFDTVIVGNGGQDMLRIPMGGTFEVVRWPVGTVPDGLSLPHPKGHVFKLVYIDGATLAPTFDKQFPVMQRIPQDVTNVVYFKSNELMRLVQKPRSEMTRWGYQIAPPEKIYLAIVALYRGDMYYANLLLDTPEAGLLDLGDMSQEAATDWLQSFRELMTGIDPFKIPVLYEHTKDAKFIQFGRPPTEMMFNELYYKYAQVVHAGYGLTMTDTGMGDQARTLAGSIRDERRSRRSGFGRARETIRNAINRDVLPDYLEFIWEENDPESMIQNGRALLTYAQALKAAKEARFITAAEGQAELVKQGLITVEVEKPEELPPPPVIPATPPPVPPTNKDETGQAQVEADTQRVPPSQGGRGDITGEAVQRSELGPASITAAPRNSGHYDQLAQVFKQAFAGISNRMDRLRLIKLIKAATRQMFPDTRRAYLAIEDSLEDDEDFIDYLDNLVNERRKAWFGQPCELDDIAEVKKANGDILDTLDEILDGENWWKMDAATAAGIAIIFRLAFSEGATRAAELVQEFLYTEGVIDSPTIVGINFDLKNPVTLARLEEKAAQLVRRVNDGTKYYLKRIVTSGVDEGLASPTIAQMIRDGADVEAILKEAGYTSRIIDTVKAEVGAMSEYRTNSITNTEINRAESEGRLAQWQEMGLTKKAWKHTGPDAPCGEVCAPNEALGYVPIDYVFQDVFDGTQTPPGHPNVCHCHLVFDEQELLGKADGLNIWTGE